MNGPSSSPQLEVQAGEPPEATEASSEKAPAQVKNVDESAFETLEPPEVHEEGGPGAFFADSETKTTPAASFAGHRPSEPPPSSQAESAEAQEAASNDAESAVPSDTENAALSEPDVDSEPPPEIEAVETTLDEFEAAELDQLDELTPESLDIAELKRDSNSEELNSDELESVHPPEVAAANEVAAAPAQSVPEAASFSENEAASSPGMAPISSERRPPPPKRSMKPRLPESPRRKPWWETLFGDDFSRAYRPPSQAQIAREVAFIEQGLNVSKQGVILDLACGQGEVTVELARRGYSVVGYDLSVFQLAVAGENAQDADQKINFLQGDMREMAFNATFDGVCCWGTSFGYFEEEKNLELAKRIFSALKPGGTLLLDVMNRDFVANESPQNIWFEGDGCVCMDDAELDWITSRLRVKRSLILDDGRSKELHYSVRIYSLSEIGKLLHDVGFRVTGVSGDVSTQGAFFGPNSPRIIISAQRPA